MSTWQLIRDPAARRTWLRQAGGVLRATASAHARPRVAWTRMLWPLVVQGVVLLLLALLCISGPPGVPEGAVLALPMGALVLLVIWQLAWLQLLETDALREVESGTLDVLTFSPLPSSAYVVGKLAFMLWLGVGGFAALLPSFALSWALSALSISALIATFLVLEAGLLAHGAWMLGEAVRSGARRGARKPAMRWAGLLSGLTVLALLFLLPTLFALQASGGGSEAVTPWLVLLSLLPATALFSTTPFALGTVLFGVAIPAWLPPLLLLAAGIPITLGTARQRWKPLPTTSGADLRLGLLAWLALAALVLVGSIRQGDPEHAGLLTGLLVTALVLVPAWAGASELSDIGARGPAPFLGILGMRRATAGRYGVATLVVLAGLAAAGAPDAVTSPWLMSMLAALTAAPFVLLAAELARWLPASRLAAWLVGVGFAVFTLFVPLLATAAKGGAGLPAGTAAAAALDLVSAASPATAIYSAAGSFAASSSVSADLVSTTLPGVGSVDLWLAGTCESLLALAVLVLVRRWWTGRSRGAALSAAATSGSR